MDYHFHQHNLLHCVPFRRSDKKENKTHRNIATKLNSFDGSPPLPFSTCRAEQTRRVCNQSVLLLSSLCPHFPLRLGSFFDTILISSLVWFRNGQEGIELMITRASCSRYDSLRCPKRGTHESRNESIFLCGDKIVEIHNDFPCGLLLGTCLSCEHSYRKWALKYSLCMIHGVENGEHFANASFF